ncbi:MAG: protein kinase [Ferruginibacter sp.]
MLLFKRYNYDPKKDLIGKGGFSRVYRALDTKTKLPVALKVYKANELTERYSPGDEVKRVINLEHPNICKYLGIEEIEEEDSFGQAERIQVCIMEFLDGGNLAAFYTLRKDLSIFKKLLVDVLQGISYLHKNGIIHRDIKPANILIKQTTGGQAVAKITDFGLSKRIDALENSTASGLMISVPYMAPEQLNPEKYGIAGKIDFNIDLWSLGVTVYEILCNDILFKNSPKDSSEQVMANIISNEVPDKIKKLPEPFNNFVSMCLVKDARLRVKTADELLTFLGPLPQDEKKDSHKEQMTVPDQAGLANIDENDTKLIYRDDVMVSPSLHVTGNDDADQEGETRLIPQKKAEELNTKKDKGEKKDFLPNSISSEPTLLQTTANKENANIVLFNRYSYNPLTDLIGRGGFSRVYKATDQKLGRLVALKIYKTNEFSDRYSPIAEIRRVVNLDHPNICRYLDIEEIEKINPFGETEKIQVCVMELLDSGNLSEYFNQCGKNIDTFKKLLEDLLHGIAYLHKNGIIHRDIKPANILIKKTIEGPVAKITDFGISKVSDSINNHTSSALIVSIPYMAPEQLNIKKYGINESISFNLDLWSLGVTIYEVITGNVLFKNSEQDSSEQIMANIMSPELPDKIKTLPQPFKNIVSHCIVKNANERAQKAEELLVLLKSAITDDPPAPPESRGSAAVEPVQEIPAPPVVVIQPPVETKPELPPAPEKPATPEPRRKIFIAEPAPEVEKRAKKRINMLKLSIAGASILLIVACLFYYHMTSDEKNVEPISQNVDSIKNKQLDTIVAASKDSTHVTNSPDTGTVSNSNSENTNAVATIKKEKPAIIKIPAAISPPVTKPHSPARIDVKFSSQCTGIINKDGSFYTKLNGGMVRGVLEEGDYEFEIVCENGTRRSKRVTISSAKKSKNGIQVVTL